MKKGRSNTIRNLGFVVFVFLFSSCSSEKQEEKKEESKKEPNEISAPADVRVASLETAIIGEIEFANSNLNTVTYRNGDLIPQAKTADEWKALVAKKEGCWAYPDFEESKSLDHGLVYSGYAVSDKRGLAPEGWKIPTRKDWETTIKSLGGKDIAGKKLKSDKGWKMNGDNSSGFNARPVPFFAGEFNHDLQVAYFWSNSVSAPEYHDHFDLDGEKDEFASWYDHDSWGLSVRCMKE